MPQVGKKKYPYTSKGVSQAKKAAKKKGMNLQDIFKSKKNARKY